MSRVQVWALVEAPASLCIRNKNFFAGDLFIPSGPPAPSISAPDPLLLPVNYQSTLPAFRGGRGDVAGSCLHCDGHCRGGTTAGGPCRGIGRAGDGTAPSRRQVSLLTRCRPLEAASGVCLWRLRSTVSRCVPLRHPRRGAYTQCSMHRRSSASLQLQRRRLPRDREMLEHAQHASAWFRPENTPWRWRRL